MKELIEQLWQVRDNIPSDAKTMHAATEAVHKVMDMIRGRRDMCQLQTRQ